MTLRFARTVDGVEDANGPLRLARECFLEMIADGELKTDVDGDEVNGRAVMYINHDIHAKDFSLRQLVEALGIPMAFDQSTEDAIRSALEREP